MPRNLLALTFIVISVVQLGQPAHVVQTADTVTTTDFVLDTTTVESETEGAVNPWVGRKIGATHIMNDVINEESKTENDIPDGNVEKEVIRHPCNRKCLQGGSPMICRYYFKVEWYQTLSKACYDCPYNGTDCGRPHCVPGDGVKRPILVVNRQMPGPSLEVCQNDEVQVEVENALLEEGTSVHWHGHHQRGTPFMDGVPFVTQCPIYPKSTFTYR